MIIVDGPSSDQSPACSPRSAVWGVDKSAGTAYDASGGLLWFQLRRLISEILADRDLEPDMYISLVGHLAENVGNPEGALLAHLRAVQDRDDLPPFNASASRRG